MIGTLYRYPHPYDSSKFLYVGQGPKRDKQHRLGKEGFGKRFKKSFPGVELPQPIREQVEVRDYLELNELETIWMFQYHTWRGYDGGMNLTFPGSDDYKYSSKMGGKRTHELHPELSTKNGYLYGPLGGRIAVESGQLDKCRTFEHQQKAGRVGGRKSSDWRKLNPEKARQIWRQGGLIQGPIQARKNVESGWIQALGRANAESGLLIRASHIRWHVNRQISNPDCKLCTAQKCDTGDINGIGERRK